MPKILYVEDNEDNVYMLTRRLERSGFEVVVAADGDRGVAVARAERPDLILMDLSLPVLDGWEATRRLKAGEQSAIPVVALTAHASREDQARARAAGCDGYLTKPVDREVLISTIKKHLASAKHLSMRSARARELPRHDVHRGPRDIDQNRGNDDEAEQPVRSGRNLQPGRRDHRAGLTAGCSKTSAH